jgi:hypothetical protein
MANFTYKCIPVPTVVNTGATGVDSHAQAVSTYQGIINNAADEIVAGNLSISTQ